MSIPCKLLRPLFVLSMLTGLQLAAGAQNPGGVTGARIWLRADAGTSTTTNNTAVSQWNDQTANVNHASQGTAANRPTFRNNSTDNLNFNPVLDFDGTNDNLNDANGIMGTGTFTNAAAFGVAVTDAVQNNTIFSEILGAGTQTVLHVPFSNGDAYWDGGAGNRVQVAWGGTTGVPYLWTGWNNNSLSPRSVLRRNGQQIATNNNAISYTGNNSTFNVGSGAAVNFMNGRIGEVIYYTNALTATQRLQVESYLALKYGLTLNQATAQNYLASDGTTVWNGTTNVTYRNNIAGIGRDDMGGAANSGLNQKQSQSENTGTQVVMALGTVAASNPANANTFSADKTFLIWGDDNGSLTTQAGTGNSSYASRFTRIWKAQITGTFTQDVTVYFPVSAFNSNVLPASISFIYGTAAADLSNGAASIIVQSGTVSINGVNCYAFTVPAAQVANLQFFSFTSSEISPGGVDANLQRWYRADAGITGTSSVSAWADQSGSGVSLTQGTASNRPAYNDSYDVTGYTINFNPSLGFDGTNDNIRNATGASFITGNGGYTAYYVATNDGAASRYVLAMGANNENGFKSGSAATATSKTSGGNVFATATNTWSPLGIPGMTRTGFTGGATQPYYLSSNSSSETTSTNASPNVAANAPISVGARPDGTANFWNGTISEVIWYSSKQTTATDINKIESYLALKYGITKPNNYVQTTGSVIWDAAANSGYANNIAGIGRDDLTALHQKQSQSVNGDFELIMSLGTVASSNQDNANTFSSDKQFFIWGDDNGSLTTQVSTGNNTYSYRFSRIWKTQNTGSFAGDITVYYPVSAFGNALPSTISLLYGTAVASLSDGTASAIPQSGTLLITNDVTFYVFTVPASQIATLQYFTFTGAQTSPGGVNNNLARWYRADAGVTTGATFTWTDQTGNANATQSTLANQPTYNVSGTELINFNSSLTFTGANAQYLTFSPTGLPTGSNPRAAFGVARSNVGGGNFEWVTSYGASGFSTEFGLLRTGNNVTVTSFLQDFTVYNTDNPYANNKPVLSYGAASGTSLKGCYNALPVVTNSGFTINTTLSTGRIGTRNALLEYWNGIISEVIHYSNEPSAAEKQRIDSYLGIKYGVSLGNNANPFSYMATDGTTVAWTGSATYQNNIAGIGRDDLTALNQKQSKSVNTGTSQVVMALGTIAATNLSNANTFSSDKQFLIWGDDNGSISTISVISGFGQPGVRLSRVWALRNTNSFNQQVTVYFPTNALDAGLGNGPKYLVYDNAAGFNGTAKTSVAAGSTTLIEGELHTAFTVTFPTTGTLFFSFGTPAVAPILTVGSAECSGTGTYSVSFFSNGTVSASTGTVSGNTIINIPTGTNVTIIATSGTGATTTAVVTSPTSCPTINGCTPPAITAGQGVCSGGGNYSVVFSASAGATITASAGTVSGNTVTGVPVGTNVTITATLAAGCSSAVTVNSPADCSTPCATPSAAFTAGTCSGATYTVYFTKTSTSVITASTGTVAGGGAGSTSGTISGIATGTSVIATVAESGCSTQIFSISAPSTTAPLLTAGDAVCSGTGTYSVTFNSNGIVTASAGTISGNTITGISVGTNVTITSTSTNGCATTTALVTSPTSCPTINGCTPPAITAGQGVCSGGGNYSVVFSASAGATITASAGTVSGNTVTGVPVGTNVTITATLAVGCSSAVTVNSPADCSTPCATPSAAFTAGTCSGATYTVYFTKTSTSVITASTGTVAGGGAGSTSGTISGIATGTAVIATVAESGCSTQIFSISAPSLSAPILSVGGAVCSGTGTYSVVFNSSGIVTASAGTISGNTITGIPTGTNVIITATSTNSCAVTQATVTSPAVCPVLNTCTPPAITAGNGVCNGTGTYSVAFSADPGATITVSAGAVSGNSIINIPVGTNVQVTATAAAGGCSTVLTVNSPADCSTSCIAPSASFSNAVSSGTVYSVYFTKSSTATLTSSVGVVTGGGAGSTSGTIAGVPVGTNITVTVSEPGCSTNYYSISSPAVGVVVNVKALLQGAISGSSMTTTLRNLNVIPLAQPYSGAPWNYAGAESVGAIPANVTDWVLVELRHAATPGTVLATRAAFMKNDGSIVDMDGVSPVSFPQIGEGAYYIAVRHRNHLGIRTAAAQYLKATALLYDFTTSQAAAYQNPGITTNTAMKDMGSGIYAMWGGNVNSNTNVRASGLANDLAALQTALGGNLSSILSNVYHNADLNMNGTVRYSGLNNDYAFLSAVLGGNLSVIFTQH